MEILKGKVQDPGFPDTEITYLKADDGKTYFFIENGTLKNGNFIATPVLKEGIGHAPYTSLGLLSPNGEVLIPFENKNIQVLSNDLLLVERNTPVTDSVKDALTKQNDPTASAELEANAKTIKDQINSVMGMNGSYVFDNQFSEAALYTTTGTNLANNYFSFIGSKEGAYYMSSNVVGSPISKYDPYAFAMNQEESEETQQETPADVQNNEVPQENVETAQAETNSVPDINIPAVDISNPVDQTVDTTPLNFDSNLLNNQEPAIPEVNPETPATETQAEEPAAVPGLDIPLFNQNIEETPNSAEEQQPTSEEQTPEVNLPSVENNQVEEPTEQPAETVKENTSDIEETSTEKEEQPTEEVEENNEGESSEIPTTDIFNEQETNSEEETSEQIENTEDSESEEKEVPEDNESEEKEDSVEEESSTEEEEQSTEEEEDSSEEESSEIPTTDIFNEEQETNSEDETSEEIENTEDSESEEPEESESEDTEESVEEETSTEKEEQPTEDEDEEEEDSGEEESTEDDTTGGTYKEEKEEDIEEQINNPVIANATSTIKKLLEENRKQRQLVDQQEGEIESLNSTNDILKEDNSSKTKEIISLRNNLGKYRKDNGELLRENNHLKSVVSRQDDLIDHLKSQNSMLKEQVAGITALGNIVAEANTVFNDGIEETSYEDNNLEYGYLDSDEDSYQYSKKSQ